jgi:hypothetical protein
VTIPSRNLVEALIAIVAIWLLVRQVPDYGSTIYLLAATAGDDSYRQNYLAEVQSIHFGVSVLVGLLLLAVRRRIGAWLVPGSDKIDSTATSLVAVGVALLGVYFVGAGVLSVANYAVVVRNVPNNDNFGLRSGTISIILGVLLFVVSVSLSKLWAMLRGRDTNAT